MNIKPSTLLLFLALLLSGCQTHKNFKNDPQNIDASHPPSVVELNFKSYGNTLNGILYQANGAGPHPTVVLLHGYPGNEKNLDLAQTMRRAGYNVLFFHYRGAWGSGGEFSFSNVIEDVGSAIDYLHTNATDIRVDANRILIVGHSMGGFAALQAAANDETIKCAAGISPADMGIVADSAQSNAEFAKSFAAGADALPMLNGWSGQKVIAELKNNRDAFSLVDLAKKLNGKSVLLVAADKDTVLAADIFHQPLVVAYQAQPNIELTHTIIPGDHSYSWSRFKLTETVMDWALKCEGPN